MDYQFPIDMDRLQQLVGTTVFEFLAKLVAAALAVLLPLHGVMGAMVTLIFFDFISGVWASWHLKTPITARRLSRTPGKILFYLVSVIAAHIFETFIFSAAPITQATAAFVAGTELKSIYENIDKVYHLNIWPQIKGYFQNMLPKK